MAKKPTKGVLTDNSIITFGKYRGQALVNVPGSYLLHLYNTPNNGLDPALKRYIKDNLEVLKQEK